MYKMSGGESSQLFNIYTDTTSYPLFPTYFIKVNEFEAVGRRMVLCIKLKQMGQIFIFSLVDIETNTFQDDWTMLSNIGAPGYTLVEQMLAKLNFALREYLDRTRKTRNSLTRDDVRVIVETAKQYYNLRLQDPTGGGPGLNQPICW